MSEFLAEARILVRPDTTSFRAQLIAQVEAATRGVTAPVTITPTIASAGLTAIASQAAAATGAVSAFADEERRGAEESRKANKERQRTADTFGQVRTAGFAAAAGMTGLRGAVLTAGGAFLATTVAIQGFARAVGSAAALETDLNVFQETAGATAFQMEQVSDTAKALGRDLTLPGVTAQDAAKTFLALSRAGLSVQNSLDGARGVLQLAVAAQINFADAAQLTASALNAFSLSGEEAVNVADVLTNAANASQASIADMGIALRQSAAIADLVGFSLSETVTFLTQLARAGLTGSDAGTSFRVSMQRLIAPTKAARGEIERLNINLRDTEGDLRPEAFFELADALERMGRAQADASRQLIFGADASRAAAFFGRLNTETFREQERVIQRSGAAADLAGARTEGFAGSVENLKNQTGAFSTEVGEDALPVIGGLADGLAFLTGALADQNREGKEWRAQFIQNIQELGNFAAELQETASDNRFTSFLGDVRKGFEDLIPDELKGELEGVNQELARTGQAFRPPVLGANELSEEQKILIINVKAARVALDEQNASLNALEQAARSAALSVKQLQGQEAGLAEQAQRARIEGDVASELEAQRRLRDTLQRELAEQQAIIARPGTEGEATAREAIRNRILPALEAANAEIERILDEQTSTRRRQAEDARRAQEDADRDLLDALSSRREDAGRRISAAAETSTLRDDIRRQNELQALIKIQIQKIKDQIKDVKIKTAAIRELRQALIDSRREEDRLRQQQRDDRLERAAEIADLNIEIAQERGNEAAIERAIRARIAIINKQIKAAKGDQVAIKRLILERLRLQNQLKELNEQEEENRRGAEEFFFEQLQAQQGFAANLLGNLITGPTAGLVGVPTAAGGGPGMPEARIRAEVQAERGLATGGPSAGQVSTTNDILIRILNELRELNGETAAPEARYQRRQASGSMDIQAM